MTYHEWIKWFYGEYGRIPTMQERYQWMKEQGYGGSGGGGGGGGGEPVEPVEPVEPEEPGGGGIAGMSPELEEIMEDFRHALATFTTQPGFITGEGGVGGWSTPVASWMRQNIPGLEHMFLEQYMKRQTADPGGQLQEYTPADWLSVFDPEQAYRMAPPYAPQPSGRVPVTTVRRLRI